MMLQTPMLATETDPVVPATVVLETKVAAPDVLEAKATSLRRAATALLVFSMLCARPCPSSWGAWLGIAAAIAVLCSTSRTKLLCRSRFARFLSFLAAIFAFYQFVTLAISFHGGLPLQIANKVHGECLEVPGETFTWMKHKLAEHKHVHKGLSFLSRHMPNATTSPTFHFSAENASHHPFVLVGAAAAEPWSQLETWSQPQACNKLAHLATCVASMMIVGSAVAHLFLFLAAVAVVKRACGLRCAAYRAGLLTWKCGGRCKSTCMRAEPPALVTPPSVAKEMA